MTKPKSTIKKYGNRRLYDTTSSRYVNIEDIARLIREGREIQVADARTGEDITRVILSQIIMEEARGPESGIPLRLLHQLVVASDRLTHDFLSWYLDTALDLYRKAGSTLMSGVAGARQAVASPLEFVRQLVTSQPSESQELERLRLRVAELEARLAALTPPKKRATARRRRPDAH